MFTFGIINLLLLETSNKSNILTNLEYWKTSLAIIVTIILKSRERENMSIPFIQHKNLEMVPISGSSFKDPKIVHSKQFEMKEPQPYREQVVCVG